MRVEGVFKQPLSDTLVSQSVCKRIEQLWQQALDLLAGHCADVYGETSFHRPFRLVLNFALPPIAQLKYHNNFIQLIQHVKRVFLGENQG